MSGLAPESSGDTPGVDHCVALQGVSTMERQCDTNHCVACARCVKKHFRSRERTHDIQALGKSTMTRVVLQTRTVAEAIKQARKKAGTHRIACDLHLHVVW